MRCRGSDKAATALATLSYPNHWTARPLGKLARKTVVSMKACEENSGTGK